MRRVALWSFVLLLCAVPAFADREGSNAVSVISSEEIAGGGTSISDLLNALPRQEIGAHVFFQDAHALVPGGGGTLGTGVIGIGGHFSMRPNPNSPFYVRGLAGWGVGSEKLEDPVVVLKANYSTLYGSVGGGVVLPIIRRGGVYGQAGLFYSTTSGTFDNGTTEVDGEAFNVFGIDTSVGVRYQLGEKNSVFFEQYSQYGWGSGEEDDLQYNETVKYGCFRGGYSFGL